MFISDSVYGIFVIAAKGTKTVTEDPTVSYSLLGHKSRMRLND